MQAPVDKHKIVFLGNHGVGKTSILRILYENFKEEYEATIGVDFSSKTFYLDGKPVRLQMWDTAGQDRFHSLIPSYIRDSKVAVIVYDVTSRQSFNAVSQWIALVAEHDSNVSIILVGNKIECSQQREVSTQEAEEFAQSRNLAYQEVSAKTGSGVNELFANRITSLLPVEQNKSETHQHMHVFQVGIAQLRVDYPHNRNVIAIAHILEQGLNSKNPQQYFTDEDAKLRAHLNKLSWTSCSILNTVLNVVIAVLQKVYAGGHALSYYLGLATPQTEAYPKFFTFGEKQQAQQLCEQMRATLR